MIVEEIVVKKLDGNQVTWKIAIGPRGKERIVDHTKLDGEIHVSLSDIEAVLRKRLETFLGSLIDEAKQQSYTWYGKIVGAKPEKGSSAKSETDNIMVDPETLVEASAPQDYTNTTNTSFRSQHQQPDDYDNDILSSELIEIGGQKVKVNIKA